MKKILIGALVCAAVAGVVFYLNDPEQFQDTVDDLKDKADEALNKAKSGFSNSEKDLRNSMS
jgi:ABC-type transporter MlaC component